MNKLFFVLFFCALPLLSNAQSKDQLAIYIPEENTSGVDTETKAYVVGEFTKILRSNGSYIIVDRSAEYRKALMKEIEHQERGFVDDAELTRLGHESGVKYICAIIFRKVFNEVNIEARLVDIERGYVIASDNRVIQRPTKETLDNEIQVMANVISGALGSKGINVRSANEMLVYSGGTNVEGYNNGRFVTLRRDDIQQRMARIPEAYQLYTDGVKKYDNSDFDILLLLIGGIPIAIGIPLMIDESTRGIGIGMAAIGAASFIPSITIPLVRKSVGRKKIKKAVELYNKQP